MCVCVCVHAWECVGICVRMRLRPVLTALQRFPLLLFGEPTSTGDMPSFHDILRHPVSGRKMKPSNAYQFGLLAGPFSSAQPSIFIAMVDVSSSQTLPDVLQQCQRSRSVPHATARALSLLDDIPSQRILSDQALRALEPVGRRGRLLVSMGSVPLTIMKQGMAPWSPPARLCLLRDHWPPSAPCGEAVSAKDPQRPTAGHTGLRLRELRGPSLVPVDPDTLAQRVRNDQARGALVSAGTR